MREIKIGDEVTVWYIKDGRVRFYHGTITNDGSFDGFIRITTADNTRVVINKDTVYDIT